MLISVAKDLVNIDIDIDISNLGGLDFGCVKNKSWHLSDFEN